MIPPQPPKGAGGNTASAPGLMQSGLIVVKGLDLTADVEREFRTGFHLEAVRSRLAQKTIAAGQIPAATIDGLGQTTMRIDPGLYHLARAVYGSDCWKDPDFRKAVRRDNPEVRTPYQKKIQIVRP